MRIHQLRRARTLLAATAVAAGAVGAALPATAAGAVAPPPPQPRYFKVAVSTPTHALVRGGAAESVTVTVTNTANRPEVFHDFVEGLSRDPGPLPSIAVTPIKAPPTGYFNGVQDGGLFSEFYPAGHPNTGFVVPAKATLSWRMAVRIGKDFPAGLSAFNITVIGSNSVNGGAGTWFTVAPTAAHATITAAASRSTVGAWQLFQVTGRTTHLAPGTRLTLEQWRGGRWVALPAQTGVNRTGGYELRVELGLVGLNRLRLVGGGAVSNTVLVTVR